MIWTLTRKEFHDNLFTFRFIFGTLISILLVLAITLANIKNFNDLNQEYLYSVQENENELKENRVYSSIQYTAYKPPEVLSVFSLGVTNRLGNSVLITRREVPYITKKYAEENPLLNMFSSLDLTLVYKIVISLLAMLFAFDTISGEKEKGTLRLLLVQRVSRFKIILGKYFGNMLTLAVSFFISLFIAFLVIIINFPNLSQESWLRILVFSLFTLSYISLFFLLGLILSSLTRKASHTFIFCLFIWIILVIIFPNLLNYLATVIKSVPPEKTTILKIREVSVPFRMKIMNWYRLNRSGYSFYGSQNTSEGKIVMRKGDETAVNFFKKFFSFAEPLYKERADEIWKVKQDFYLLLKQQESLATLLNRVSPAGFYQEVAEMVSRTGVSNYEKFIQQAIIFRESIFDYFNSKNAYSSLRFFTVMEEEDILPKGEKISGIIPKIEDYPPLNLSDFPRFEYQRERLSDIFPELIFFLMVFILINLILFMGSAVVFNLYDVR